MLNEKIDMDKEVERVKKMYRNVFTEDVLKIYYRNAHLTLLNFVYFKEEDDIC